MAEGGPPRAPANNDVNEQFLASLMEMGIHRDAARQALILSNNRSLEDALAIVFGEAPFFSDEATRTSGGGARVEQATQFSYESSVIPAESTATDEEMRNYKMLFVVNGSLRMSSGKMAAQVAHASVDLYQQILNQRLMSLNFWRLFGETKIVVRGNSTEELIDLESKASRDKSIVTSTIRDAGRTEIASGSITCLGLFGSGKQLDPITGHLKLMNDCLKCSGTDVQRPPAQQNVSKKSRKAKQQETDDAEAKPAPSEEAPSEEKTQ